MCYTLSAEKILLNYFAESCQKSISVDRLSDLSDKIAKACSYGILIKMDRDAIGSAVSHFPDIFSLEDGVISLKEEDNFYIANLSIINRDMPAFVREKCVEECMSF